MARPPSALNPWAARRDYALDLGRYRVVRPGRSSNSGARVLGLSRRLRPAHPRAGCREQPDWEMQLAKCRVTMLRPKRDLGFWLLSGRVIRGVKYERPCKVDFDGSDNRRRSSRRSSVMRGISTESVAQPTDAASGRR